MHKGATPAPLPCCGKIAIRHLAVELLDLLHFRGLLRHSARMRTSIPLTCARQFRSQSTGYVLELDRSVPALQLKEGRQLRCRVVSSPADSNSRAGTIVPRGKRRQPVEESVTTTGQVPVSVSSQSTGMTTIPSGTCARSSLFGSPRSRWFSAHSDGHTTLRRVLCGHRATGTRGVWWPSLPDRRPWSPHHHSGHVDSQHVCTHVPGRATDGRIVAVRMCVVGARARAQYGCTVWATCACCSLCFSSTSRSTSWCSGPHAATCCCTSSICCCSCCCRICMLCCVCSHCCWAYCRARSVSDGPALALASWLTVSPAALRICAGIAVQKSLALQALQSSRRLLHWLLPAMQAVQKSSTARVDFSPGSASQAHARVPASFS